MLSSSSAVLLSGAEDERARTICVPSACLRCSVFSNRQARPFIPLSRAHRLLLFFFFFLSRVPSLVLTRPHHSHPFLSFSHFAISSPSARCRSSVRFPSSPSVPRCSVWDVSRIHREGTEGARMVLSREAWSVHSPSRVWLQGALPFRSCSRSPPLSAPSLIHPRRRPLFSVDTSRSHSASNLQIHYQTRLRRRSIASSRARVRPRRVLARVIVDRARDQAPLEEVEQSVRCHV